MTTVRITPTMDGPLEVEGEATIVTPDGTVIKETTKTYLCRCGSGLRGLVGRGWRGIDKITAIR